MSDDNDDKKNELTFDEQCILDDSVFWKLYYNIDSNKIRYLIKKCRDSNKSAYDILIHNITIGEFVNIYIVRTYRKKIHLKREKSRRIRFNHTSRMSNRHKNTKGKMGSSKKINNN